MQDSKVITVKGEWGRQSSKHFNWCDVRYMNMQYAFSGKVWCLSVHAASNATLLSTWTYLMNKMSRRANTKSCGAINFKAYVAKWEKTKLHIRLIKNETGSNIHILTHITPPFFFTPEFFRSLLLSFSPALDEHNPDIPEWREDIGRVVRTALSQVHRDHIALRSLLELTSATSGFQGHYYFIPVCSIDTAVMMFYGPCVKLGLFLPYLWRY